MKKLLRIFSVIAFTAASHFAQAQSATQVSITGTGGAYSIPNNSATVVDNGIVVTANGNITDFTVSITGSYTNLDILGYSGALPVGITAAAFNAATRSIQFFGTASPTVWQELLRRVTLTTTSAVCFPEQRQVSFVVGNTFFNPLNHHFYKLVTTSKSWTTARNDAANSSYFGYQGYLATISSAAENNFIDAFISVNSWIGCSDNYNQINNAVNYSKYSNQSNAEGKFHWVTGPEKGTQMRTGNAAGGNLGSNIAGVYSNWQNSEPNDYPNSGTVGEEDYGHLYADGSWNDFPESQSIASIVEFGGMPNDLSVSDVVYTRTININGAPTSTITGGNVSVCPGGNATLTLGSFSGSVVRWEYSIDNFITPGVAINNTTTTLNLTNLTETRYYRAVVTISSPNCTNLPTSSTIVTVNSVVTGNVIADMAQICAGGQALLSVFGNSGSVVDWQVSTVSNFSTFTTINSTSTSINYTLASNGTYYFRARIQNAGCGSPVASPSATVTVVSGTPPIGGTVSSTTHCGGSNSGTLTLSGHSGTIQKWQYSTDGGVIWTDISNTTTSQAYSGISLTRKYRAVLQNGSCGTAFSNPGTVTVYNFTATNSSPLCSGNNLQLGVVTNGGNGPFTFSWTGPNSFVSSDQNPAITDVSTAATGTYTVSVTAPGCSASPTTTAAITASPTITSTTPAARCSNGTITLVAAASAGSVKWFANASGGTALFTGNSYTTPSLNTTTTYYVEADNGTCHTATRTAVTATIGSNPSVTPASQTNVACNGGATGAAAINTPTGGTGSYTYNWTPGNPTGDGTTSVSGLAAGTYICTVTDANACTASQSFTITQPAVLAVTPASQTNVACNGGANGAASINTPTGGAGSYTYNWTPGNPTGDGTRSVSGLAAGTYICTVTDANACTVSQSFTITQPAVLAVTPASHTNVACNGGANGAASINTPTGGAGGYSYNWTPGNPPGDGTRSVSGLAAGTYICTVTDANACTVSQSFTITQPAVLASTISETGCDSLVINGHKYFASGTYTQTLTSINNCDSILTLNLTINSSALAKTITAADEEICTGESTNINIANSEIGVTYTLRNDFDDSTIGTPVAGNGSTISLNTGALNANTTFNVLGAFQQQGALDFRGNAFVDYVNIGNSMNTVFAGTNKITVEAWVKRNNLGSLQTIVSNYQTGMQFLLRIDGDKATFWVSNGIFQYVQGATTVPVGSWVHIAGTWDGTAIRVYLNGTQDGMASVSGNFVASSNDLKIGGGLNNNTEYFPGSIGNVRIWNVTRSALQINDNKALCIPSDNTGLLAYYTMADGTGSTTLTDMSGNGYNGTLTNMNPTTAWVNAPTALVCPAGCDKEMNNTVTVAINAPTSGSISETACNSYTLNNQTYTSSGTYTQSLTNAAGCDSTLTINLTINNSPTTEVSSQSNVTCNGGTNGQATIGATGAAPFQYVWSPSGGTAATASGLAAGAYTCTVTDANSCTATQSVTITQPAVLAVTPASQTNVACNGGANGAASINTPTGGAGGYTYNWTPGNPNGDGTRSVTALTAGSWTCTVTDANSCTASQSFTITQPAALAVTANSQTNVLCHGAATGAASINTPTGGAGSYTYNWTPGNPTGDGTTSVTGLAAGTWICTVTDANSCTANQQFTLTQAAAVNVTVASFSNVTCIGGNNGDITLNTPSGGDGNYTFNWTPGNPNGDGTNSVSELTAGLWKCTVTDGNGCEGEVVQLLIESDTEAPVAVAQDLTVYVDGNGNASITANDANNGSHDNCGIALMSVNVTSVNCQDIGGQLPAILTVEDQAGNQNSTTFNITVLDTVKPIVHTNDITITLDGNGQASIVAADINDSSTDNCQIDQYSIDKTDFTCANIGDNNVILTVTDIHGNTSTATAIVTVNQGVQVVNIGTPDITNASCNGSSNGAITLNPSGGTGSYTYTWTPNVSSSNTASGLTAGDYTIVVQDGNGCQATATLDITQPATGSFTVQPTDQTICQGDTAHFEGTFTGTGTINYQWQMELWIFGFGDIQDETNAHMDWTLSSPLMNGTRLRLKATDDCGTYYSNPVRVYINPTYLDSVDANICAGQTYTLPDGNVVADAGYYTSTFQSIRSCDSTIVTNLMVHPAVTSNVSAAICQGATYTLPDGNLVSTAGDYSVTLQTINGCDSTIVTSLIVNPVYNNAVSAQICEGATYTLPDNSEVSTAGEYSVTLQTINGCDSTIVTTLIVNPVYNNAVSAQICEGATYTLPDNSEVSTAGDYSVTLQTINGCDSTIVTTLIVNPVYNNAVSAQICEGDSYTLPDNSEVSTAGEYSVTLQSVNGCDSTIVTTLIVNPVYNNAVSAQICEGAIYTLPDGNMVSTAGDYSVTLPTINGCDSTIVTTLIVNPVYNNAVSAQICEGATYTLPDGNQVSDAGEYSVTLQSTYGCDSTIVTTLIVNPVYNNAVSAQICEGATYTLPDNSEVSTAGEYSVTLQSTNGCDSTIVTTLIVNPVYNNAVSAQICEGATYTLPNGNEVSTAGEYSVTLQTINGCDSTIVTTLMVNPTYALAVSDSICEGGEYLLPDGSSVSEAGDYTVTIQSSMGCDSTITTHLFIKQGYDISNNVSICPNGSYTLPDGQVVTEPGVYISTFQTEMGCDSIITTFIILRPGMNSMVEASICEGDTYTLPDGTVVSTEGSYPVTLQSSEGCDSTITTRLTLITRPKSYESAVVCFGESYTLPDGRVVNSAGEYTSTFEIPNSCDSLVITTLQFKPANTRTVQASFCIGGSYTLPNNDIVYLPGVYVTTWPSADGCDSSIVTDLKLYAPADTLYQSATICSNENHTLPDGESVNTSGTYYSHLFTVNGCDSTVVTTLTVNPAKSADVVISICEGSSHTLPNGTTITAAGNYTTTLQTSAGCDSVINTRLIVYPTHLNVVAAAICQGDSLQLPGGSFAFASGTYRDTLDAVFGCDSIIITNLTVNPARASHITASICQGDLYVLPSGTAVAQAGTYTDTLSTPAGCDSIITVDLSVFVKPTVNIAELEESYCLGIAPLTLSATPTGGTFNGFGMAGNIFSVNAAGIGSWPVYYTFTSEQGCTAIDTAYVNVVQCPDVSIEDVSGVQFEIYPNPASELLNIRFNNGTRTKAGLSVFDARGRLVFAESAQEFSQDAAVRLNISNYDPGVYVIRLIHNGRMYTQRFVVN